MMLLKANLSIGLFLQIIIDNLSTVMTSCLPIIGPRKVVVDILMIMIGMVVIFD